MNPFEELVQGIKQEKKWYKIYFFFNYFFLLSLLGIICYSLPEFWWEKITVVLLFSLFYKKIFNYCFGELAQ